MKTYEGYLIDLDGTMYRGDEPIESARQFIEELVAADLPYLFLTNNSALRPEDLVTKLNSLNIPANPKQIMTSSIATAKYIRSQKEKARCFTIGEEGLKAALKAEGLQLVDEIDCDYVVIGIDRQISYEKLAKACLAVRKGAAFLSTNSDTAIPTERGLVPGNGALTSVVSVSTGVEPVFIGKPEKIIMDYALEILQVDRNRVLMVGDNYATDIMAGINSDLKTLLVFTGVTAYDEYEELAVKPTHCTFDLMDWWQT